MLKKMELKKVEIYPAEDIILNKDYCSRKLNEIVEAKRVFLRVDHKNKHFLFLFGMLFNVLHYLDNEKYLIHDGNLERTPRKSISNVLLDLLSNNAEFQPKYEIHEKKAFMTSPVRSTEDELAYKLRDFKNKEMESGRFKYIHYPLDDTNQEDLDFHASRRICIENNLYLAPAGTNQIYYKTDSGGSVFDTGEYFSFRHLVDRVTRQTLIRRLDIINDRVNGVNHVPPNVDQDYYFKFLRSLEKDEK